VREKGETGTPRTCPTHPLPHPTPATPHHVNHSPSPHLPHPSPTLRPPSGRANIQCPSWNILSNGSVCIHLPPSLLPACHLHCPPPLIPITYLPWRLPTFHTHWRCHGATASPCLPTPPTCTIPSFLCSCCAGTCPLPAHTHPYLNRITIGVSCDAACDCTACETRCSVLPLC